MKAIERALYRGKRLDNGEWVEGQYYEGVVYPSSYRTHNIVVNGGEVGVDPETVGQWTGLTDSNGKKIFEGDMVEYENIHIGSLGYEIFFDLGQYWFDENLLSGWCDEIIVIGNVHDK